MIGAFMLLAFCGGQAHAIGPDWNARAKDGDIVVDDGGKVAFSATSYARSLVPDNYRLSAGPPGRECAIEIDIKPLSLLGNALSFALTYRRLPGECSQPLRSGGYLAVRSVRLGSNEPARIDDYVRLAPLLQAFRRSRDIADLTSGGTSARSLTALFNELSQATAGRCERRLTPASRSQFFVDAINEGTVDLRIAFSNECGQLGDEPRLEALSLLLRQSDLNDGVSARPLTLRPLHLRFISTD